MMAQKSLSQTLSTTESLLKQYLDVLTATSTSTISLSDPPPLLKLISDSARLLKAQVTKLSLLAINKPFTPSAISTVIREISGTCLPAMMSAVQICDTQKEQFGSFFATELRARVRRIVREMQSLLSEVKSIEQENAATKSKTISTTGRDSLSSTGVVWNGCDELSSLATMGVPGLAVQKAEAFRDTIKDAITELQEWREGGDEGNEGVEDGLLDSDDEGVDGDRDSFDDLFNAANSLPADRPDLRLLTIDAEDKLKKVAILYTALIKRRFKTLPSPANKATSTEGVDLVDSLLTILKALPDMIDEMASTLYELDEAGARSALTEIVNTAIACVVKAQFNLEGQEDEFTAWSSKWKDAIK